MAGARASWRWVTLIAVLSLAIAPHALADGKFYATLTVQDDPTIPSQRAIIVHRDGVQTLIVESEVESEADELGWILPLPAVPTEIAPTTPGVLKTMRELVQPKFIWRRDTGPLQGMAIYLVIVLLLAHVAGFQSRTKSRRTAFAMTFFVCILIPALLLPAIGTARRSAASSASILSTTNAGSYEVTVLRGETGGVVRDWLEANGFRCDEGSEAVLDAYVRDGWVFAAAKLGRTEAGPMSHHPLKITFPIDEPVYPMRLTGVGATALQLDLYIIAESKATAPDLEAWQCDRMLPFQAPPRYGTPPDFSTAYYRGEHHQFTTGHPVIMNLMWDGCIFTHLKATLPPEALQRDVTLAFIDYEPSRKQFFTTTSARQFSTAMGLLAIALVLFVLGIAGVSPLPGTERTRRIIATLYAFLAIAALALPLTLPSLEVSEKRGHPIRTSSLAREMAKALEFGLTERPDGKPLEVLDELTTKDVEKRLLDVPGGIVAKRLDDGGWEIVAYDNFAAPMRIIVPGAASEYRRED